MTSSKISKALGIRFLSLNFHMQNLNNENVRPRFLFSSPPRIPCQYIFLRSGLLPCMMLPAKRRNPFRAARVTGQSRKRWLKVSLLAVSGFRIRHWQHLSVTSARKWATRPFSPKQLFLSLKRNSRRSFGKKLQFHSPR